MKTAPPQSGTALRKICRTYREAAISYDRAFVRGDACAIEKAFSRMQEIARAFDQGAQWASRQIANASRKTTGRR